MKRWVNFDVRGLDIRYAGRRMMFRLMVVRSCASSSDLTHPETVRYRRGKAPHTIRPDSGSFADDVSLSVYKIDSDDSFGVPKVTGPSKATVRIRKSASRRIISGQNRQPADIFTDPLVFHLVTETSTNVNVVFNE